MVNLTQQLSYQQQTLFFENFSIQKLAEKIGTPFYCYSQRAIVDNIKQCQTAFSDPRFHIHYALKANSNLSILKIVAAQNLSADIVSIGEMQRALLAGFSSQQIIFSGVGKTSSEIQQAMQQGVGQFNIESAEELELLIQLAADANHTVNAMIRVNPEVSISTHKNITTGAKGNKFGVRLDQVLKMLHSAKNTQVKIQGLAMHIGSQIQQTTPYLAAIDKLLLHIEMFKTEGFILNNIDLGGGFGISYGQEKSLTFTQFSDVIMQKLKDWKGKIYIEPGRSIIADAGLLITPITYIKHAEPRPFVILEAAMNDLMRPALYQAIHPIITVAQKQGEQQYDVVGPVCESTDTFEKKAKLPALLTPGELVCFLYAGAYCAVMSNSYNSRNIISEVLVNGEEASCIRTAIKQQDLLQFETQPYQLLS
ncbi:diaminopimelate decarboxylase [Agarivorans sp. QJM3NY_33]|uniref:diaminopimelate decarboxylase n=1 Tax=Agarivorans sp. QJM3NY_33 TaxID=3421432 RepID=UPI003D7E799C